MVEGLSVPPSAPPPTHFPDTPGELHRQGDWLWIPLRQEWRNVSHQPEEMVRQRFICQLHQDVGYSLEQMDQERRTTHGHRSPRADIVVWSTASDKASNRTPCLVVECKDESVGVSVKDYYQGESYARATGCEFLVAHNHRFTGVFKLVPGVPGDIVAISEIPRAEDWGDAKRIDEIKNRLRVFNRREFQNLLFECHTILRDVHKMEPGRAFDTISKILFIKMYIERIGSYGTFTVEFIDRRTATMLAGDRPLHEELFNQTKEYYGADELFAPTDNLEVATNVFRRIVQKLQGFNLSQTNDDVKGIAFEQFLGTTFRGDLGQHFTPRTVVDFMIEVLEPREGEIICDPAAGSGGFLIRAFEYLREQIIDDVDRQKDEIRASIEAEDGPDEEKDDRVAEAFKALNEELRPSGENNRPIDTRVGRLAWECIFGCDAEPRAARTAKMNMIMHGDGHGGIHYHDGLVDVDGISPERFDIVVTNPPFGSNVGADQTVGGNVETHVSRDAGYEERGTRRYGPGWLDRHRQLRLAAENNRRILDLYEIGLGKNNRPTETIFIERSLGLLKPGGRMGIVLPDGNLNNPSLAWLRRWCEGKARVTAVVSLPEDTFHYSDTTAKTSVVFLRRFDDRDQEEWEAAWQHAHGVHDHNFNSSRDELCHRYEAGILTGDDEQVAATLSSLLACGVQREGYRWTPGAPPAYPRGVGATKLVTPKWIDEAPDREAKRRAGQLKREYSSLFKTRAASKSRAWLSQLRAEMKKLDEEHNNALWATVRETFDYPVFVASPTSVGVSSGVDEVPNELPAVRDAYRQFAAWCEDGAPWERMPEFELPPDAL